MDESQPPRRHDATRFSSEDRDFEHQAALYRLRAEEFERNLLSFRAVEWQLYFQVYAGYASVAAAIFAMRTSERSTVPGPASSVIALAILLIIFFAGLFCQLQIQRRLHFTRGMQNTYLEALHLQLAPELRIPEGTLRPGFQKWWAFVPQLLLNLSSLGAVAMYIVLSTKWC